jgi:hypothetical protein
MKAAFEVTCKLVQATSFEVVTEIQSDFMRRQFTSAGEHMRNIMSGGS